MDSSSWSKLPPELMELIFRCRSMNTKDLGRCRLVCTTWRLRIADIWEKNFSLLRTANTKATRRIVRDYKNFQRETFRCCEAELVDSLFHWEAIMIGPKDTPYADGVFLLKIDLPPDYPFEPPEVKFLTKVYHPNIDQQGRLCLEGSWSPVMTISHVLLVIYALLKAPDPDDPIDFEIAHIYKTQRIQFEESARAWTRQFATASQTVQ